MTIIVNDGIIILITTGRYNQPTTSTYTTTALESPLNTRVTTDTTSTEKSLPIIKTPPTSEVWLYKHHMYQYACTYCMHSIMYHMHG